ncbi:TIR domain-containing protein [Haliscomenobacter sp.]|uniref:TIR domain-containing protein n=1 Tax=Haliscomenobacter sp. TaxID=2717303 RepID=UPI003BAAFDE7
MDIKPNVFIGSSAEGLPVARLVKKYLADFAECNVWDEDIFEFNKSYFETLMELLSFYDYGILIGTADDLVVSREVTTQETRDNVLFEFGLFMGRLGKNKVFFMKEKGAKTPSDLSGIALPVFSREGDNLEQQIKERCEQIVKQIRGRSNIFEGGIYPSIPLAYGYFHNSLLPTCDYFLRSSKVIWKGQEKEIKDYHIHILIPDDLRSDMKKKVELAKKRDTWSPIEVPVFFPRSYIFYVQESKLDLNHLALFDIPTTLNSLHQTIDEFIGSKQLGRGIKEKLVEGREIRHFQKVLKYLIESHDETKNFITTEIIDI